MSRIVTARQIGLVGCLMSCGFITGCGSGVPAEPVLKLVPVSGTVTIDGKPAENVRITFLPATQALVRGGWALTDESGNFTALSVPSQKEGLPAGNYRVTYSKFVKPNGAVLAPGESPVAASAKETIPVSWSNAQYAGSHNAVLVPEAGTSELQLKVNTKVLGKGAPAS